ncbi:MAG: glycosyltransferase family 4 protein [Ilumatobacteraceae bacterium]
MKKRVAVNMLWSVPGVGGSEEYLARQLIGLAEIGADLDVHVFAPRGFAARRTDVSMLWPVHEAPSDATRRAARIGLEHTWLAAQTRAFDVVHHGGGTVPRVGNRSTLLTVHDVQWTEFPDYVSGVKLRYLRKMVPSSLARASHIAVPSNFVASTLVREFGTDRTRIGVVRHGLESTMEHFLTPTAELRAKFALGDGPIVVYPAVTHPHKNHRFLLELMAHGGGSWADPTLRLVFAGSAGRADTEVRQMVRDLRLDDRVVMCGHVDAFDRNGLLLAADAMVFPSEYEGFGAPVIEAMQFSAPVICSDRGSLPEVVGDAALVLPLTLDAWRGALDVVRTERARLTSAGHRRTREFTAAKSAEDLVEQYETVMRGAR